MKKIGVILTLLVLVSFLVGMIGCGEPTQTTAPTIKPEPTTTTQPTEMKPVKLTWGDYRSHGPEPFYDLHKVYAWIPAMEGATNGRIIIEDYPSQSLISYPMAEMQVSQGLADMGGGSRLQKGILPIMDVMKLPPTHGETTAMENLMIHYFKLNDVFQKDFDELNLLGLGPIALEPYKFVTAKKPIRRLADLAGMTLMSTDVMTISLLKKNGVTVLPIPSTQGYEALEKGMADGGVWNWEGPFIFGWDDAFDPGYFIDAGHVVRGGGSMNVFMNKDSYKKVPKDLEDVFNQVIWRWAGVHFAAQIDENITLYIEECKKRGIQLIEWSQADKEALNVMKEAIIEEWVDEMEDMYGRGADAEEVLALYNAAAEEYVPPAPVPVCGPADKTGRWDEVFGPGSTWGMDYKAYPNQIGLYELEGGKFQSW